MKIISTIGALALATAAFQIAGLGPANAAQDPAQRKLAISKAAQKPIAELQAAIAAKDVANIPAKLAAAQAAAKSPDEKLIVAKFQLTAAVAANDEAAQVAAVEALIASGGDRKSVV